MVRMKKNFWFNKKVLITGHTGFKGSWLTLWLNHLGANIMGYSLPLTNNEYLFKKLKLQNLSKITNIFDDINNFSNLKKNIEKFKPDIIFHLAAQPIVIDSYKKPLNTFNTNIIGTANLLQSCLRIRNLKSIVIVTSDKCYENNDVQFNFKENDKLGGDDPYSASKAACEIITNSYSKSFLSDVGIATARSGNVIGGGDRGKQRLVTDIINSLKENKILKLRNPGSTRPWQHVFETLNGYIVLSEKLYKNKNKYKGAWNFGPNNKKISTKDIALKIAKLWGKILGWNNKFKIDETILQIVEWEKQNLIDKNMYKFSLSQLLNYINK